MITFTEREFLCSRMGEESQLPALSYEREPVSLKSTITDYEGLFIGFGGRETAYPYTEQNLYSDTEKKMLPVAILENEYLYAEFLPSLGGRLWRLYDKNTAEMSSMPMTPSVCGISVYATRGSLAVSNGTAA